MTGQRHSAAADSHAPLKRFRRPVTSLGHATGVIDAEIAEKGHFWTETDYPVAEKGGTGRSHLIFKMQKYKF
jgi:hypothetical protein